VICAGCPKGQSKFILWQDVSPLDHDEASPDPGLEACPYQKRGKPDRNLFEYATLNIHPVALTGIMSPSPPHREGMSVTGRTSPRLQRKTNRLRYGTLSGHWQSTERTLHQQNRFACLLMRLIEEIAHFPWRLVPTRIGVLTKIMAGLLNSCH
jgi:hypothetical protein